MHHLALFAIGGCLLSHPGPTAYASVIPPRIAELAESSQLIVLAKVESISGSDELENRRAKATVKEVWKGEKLESVEYRVSPTFACDISDARPGETVLLFLEKDEKAGWSINWAGRGRMPMINIKEKSRLSYYNVIFPKEIDRIKIPKNVESEFDDAVEMSVVKELVRKAIAPKK